MIEPTVSPRRTTSKPLSAKNCGVVVAEAHLRRRLAIDLGHEVDAVQEQHSAVRVGDPATVVTDGPRQRLGRERAAHCRPPETSCSAPESPSARRKPRPAEERCARFIVVSPTPRPRVSTPGVRLLHRPSTSLCRPTTGLSSHRRPATTSSRRALPGSPPSTPQGADHRRSVMSEIVAGSSISRSRSMPSPPG